MRTGLLLILIVMNATYEHHVGGSSYDMPVGIAIMLFICLVASALQDINEIILWRDR